jgi:peptidoglycan/xylan/chitin deacetylase (PgdA/CDA1 family)
MKIIILILCASFTSLGFVDFEQYPEDRTYTSKDRGLRPYSSLSVYQTGTYALTFDDGPDPYRTPKILDVLKAFNVKATFFLLTNNINNSNFPIIKRMLEEGHIIASHGPSHDRSGSLKKAEWKRQTKESFKKLAYWHKLAGHEFNKFYYRFPYGDYGTRKDYHHINALKEVSQELMGDNCIHMAFWDVDTSDWVTGITAQEIAQNIISHNEGGKYIGFEKKGKSYVKVPMMIKDPTAGGVILQHDTKKYSVEALKLFLKYAVEKNLRILRIDEIDEFRITKTCKL